MKYFLTIFICGLACGTGWAQSGKSLGYDKISKFEDQRARVQLNDFGESLIGTAMRSLLLNTKGSCLTNSNGLEY